MISPTQNAHNMSCIFFYGQKRIAQYSISYCINYSIKTCSVSIFLYVLINGKAPVIYKNFYNDELVRLLVQAVLTSVAQNLVKEDILEITESTDHKAADIMQYVQANIYDPKKLTGENISEVFGISKTYIGRYCKNNTGKTLNEYAAQYRMKLIENRLQYSDMRISEITDEFGFTDKSHLNRFFKKVKGISPSVFRNE